MSARSRRPGAGQAAIDVPAPRQYAVRVNEVLALTYTSRETANWWALYRGHGPAERFAIVSAGFIGDTVDVICDDHEHADWLHGYLIERGIPKAALKITERTDRP